VYFSTIILHAKKRFIFKGCQHRRSFLFLLLLLLAVFPLFWLALLTEEMEYTLD
jgi:hypothetical protein